MADVDNNGVKRVAAHIQGVGIGIVLGGMYASFDSYYPYTILGGALVLIVISYGFDRCSDAAVSE